MTKKTPFKLIEREEDGTVSFGFFEYVIQSLILISMIVFSIETLPNLSEAGIRTLRIIEIVTVAIFTLEYVLRLGLSQRRARYAFSFYGLIDLLAILPFYIGTGVDLRVVRAFRLIRLFRLIKVARYSQAIRRFHRAFVSIREELILFGVTTLIVLYLASVGIYYFESSSQPDKFGSVFESMWWAVATLTTVGYGDAFPITTGGRIFTFLILLVGLGVVAVPTGLFASALSAAKDEVKKDSVSSETSNSDEHDRAL